LKIECIPPCFSDKIGCKKLFPALSEKFNKKGDEK